MNWAAIVASILSILGPILSDLLKKWLGPKLSHAVEHLKDPTGDAAVDHLNALKAVYDATPRYQFRRRAFVRHAMDVVPAAATTGYLQPHDAAELAALADSASDE